MLVNWLIIEKYGKRWLMSLGKHCRGKYLSISYPKSPKSHNVEQEANRLCYLNSTF